MNKESIVSKLPVSFELTNQKHYLIVSDDYGYNTSLEQKEVIALIEKLLTLAKQMKSV